MSIDEDFAPEIVAEPILIRQEAPLAGSRRRAASSDTLAIWGAVLLIAGIVGSYALVKAYRTETPPAPGQPRVVASAPEPEPRPKPAPTPKRTRQATTPAKYAPEVVVNHVEPERKVVDPIAGFDTGEAFDNPTSPGRYGQRSSGLLERAPARPNQPDPSFGRTPQ